LSKTGINLWVEYLNGQSHGQSPELKSCHGYVIAVYKLEFAVLEYNNTLWNGTPIDCVLSILIE